jgi:hypothetical protein
LLTLRSRAPPRFARRNCSRDGNTVVSSEKSRSSNLIAQDIGACCFWQLALAHFGGLIWPTLGTLKFRGNVLFCWSGAPRAERKQNRTGTSPVITSFASFPAFFGNGTTRRRSR